MEISIFGDFLRNRVKIEVKKILDNIDFTLRNRFNEIRRQHFNPNTKGYEYEKIVAKFFEEYLGGVLDFHVRAALIDSDLKAFEVFSYGENEFDVIATYKSASPRIVLKVGDVKYIPFDSVALLIEVKQTLNKNNLN